MTGEAAAAAAADFVQSNVTRSSEPSALKITDLHLEVVKQHLRPNSGFFLPTPEGDSVPSNDRPWS